MQVPRKILTLLVAGALLVVGMAASIALLYPSLPDPESADREGLVRWLVMRDLRRESMQTRGALARRFEEEFCADSNAGTSDPSHSPDWDLLAARLDQTQRRLFWDNLPVVLEPWFLEKADRYDELAEPERTPYVDRILDMMAVLDGISAVQPDGGKTDEPAGEGGWRTMLLGHVQQWRQEAEPAGQERIDQLLAHIQQRWFLRTLGLSTSQR